ncbi:sensor histidine kinase [Streptomyces sp. NPDC002073]
MRTPRSTPDADASRLPAPPARGRRAHAGPPAEEHPTAGPRSAAGGAPGPASSVPAAPAAPAPLRLRLRPGTVRAKIVSLLMVPVVSLLALWAFATVSTAQDVARLGRIQRVDEQIRIPVGRAVTELQAERRAAVRYLGAPGGDLAAALSAQGRRTDAALDRLRLGGRHTVADSGDHPPAVSRTLREFVAAADALSAVRTDVGARKTTRDAAFEAYTEVVGAAFAVSGALAGSDGAEGAGHGSEARVLLEFTRAAEQLAREDAVLAGRTGAGTRLGAEDLRRFTAAAESRRTLTEAAAADLPAAQRASWQATGRGAAYATLTAVEDRLLGADTRTGGGSGGGRVGERAADRDVPAGWDTAAAEVATAMRAVENAARDSAADRADPLAEGVVSVAGAAVLLGLAAVAASLVISVRIGRALVVELVSLRNGALEIAHRKLPEAMDRLRAGQDIDVAAETPEGTPADDEIAQVGEALATVHRAALSAAVERAELASGVSGVFVNLARRSQVLVHRQLNLLDSMERRADDPGELGDLFRLDHLTTRMRRHAESLIILSGAAPGRAWRMPVPLTNVVRAAVSEIEDYPRVEVRRLAETSVAGAAVADLTHLLAELVENAAQFSPPHTKVRVSGEPVGTGYVLEVEDRGLGMGRESLAEANRRIEQSEALDLFDSDRLGLFVVSRLSARHGVKVHLRPSPYGGTTAVVLLPTSLLQGALPAGAPEPEPEPEPEAGADGAEGAAAPGVPARNGQARSRLAESAPGRGGPWSQAPDAERPAAPRPFAAWETPMGQVPARQVPVGQAPARQTQAGPAASGPAASGVTALGPGASGPGHTYERAASERPTARRAGSDGTGSGATGSAAGGSGGSGGSGGHGGHGGHDSSGGSGSSGGPAGRPTPERTPAPDQAPAPVSTLRPRGAGGTGAGGPGSRTVLRATAPVPLPAGPGALPAGVTELPRRVRQASLVPQLREAPAPAAPAGVRAPEDPPGRSPEEARDRMSAYRAGWARGAADATRAGSEGDQS